MTPDRHFERQWALALLDQAMTGLRTEYTRAGKERIFDHCKAALARGETSMADIARQLGISENAAKVAAHRLRTATANCCVRKWLHTLTDPGRDRR